MGQTKDPVLERLTLPNKNRLVIHGGLHKLKGNKHPYFSITSDEYEPAAHKTFCWTSGGCQHELILEHAPHLKPLIQLHLSDVTGAPSHAAANGWYWFAGYIQSQERYHGGTGSDARSPAECFRIWCEHLRLSPETAHQLADRIRAKWNIPDMKAEHAKVVDEQRPRWAMEAAAAIEQFNLVVYGDVQ